MLNKYLDVISNTNLSKMNLSSASFYDKVGLQSKPNLKVTMPSLTLYFDAPDNASREVIELRVYSSGNSRLEVRRLYDYDTTKSMFMTYEPATTIGIDKFSETKKVWVALENFIQERKLVLNFGNENNSATYYPN